MIFELQNNTARQRARVGLLRLMITPERVFAAEVRKILDLTWKRAATLIEGYADPIGVPGAAVSTYSASLERSLLTHYKRVASIFSDLAWRSVGVKSALEGEFWRSQDLWAKTNAAKKVTKIDNTTRTRINRALREGLDAGETPALVAKRLRETGKFDRTRATLIARTETHQASQYAVDQSMKVTKIPMDRIWTSAGDARTRAAHRAANRQRRPMGEPFLVGGELLMFPGDPMGSAKNVIRCRCVLMYVRAMAARKPTTTPPAKPMPIVVEPPPPPMDVLPPDVPTPVKPLPPPEIPPAMPIPEVSLSWEDLAIRDAIWTDAIGQDETARIMGAVKNRLEHSHVITRRQSETAVKILEEGRFKTQLETRRSGGSYAPELRIKHEFDLFGKHWDDPKERPIYGYLDEDEFGVQAGDRAERYGDVGFRLKKDTRTRTTFTANDSLAMTDPVADKNPAAYLPSLIDDPKVSSMFDTYYVGKERLRDRTGPLMRELEGGQSLYESVQTAIGTPYIEAQIQGGVTVENVDAIMIYRSQSRAYRNVETGRIEFRFSESDKKVIDLAHKRDIPVYQQTEGENQWRRIENE